MPFTPPEPPIVPNDPTEPPALTTPAPPPEVGFSSPWAPADSENRDRILDWWRMWFRRTFMVWTSEWSAYWSAQWTSIVDYLNTWLDSAGDYISANAVAGHSWRVTETPIVSPGITLVEITPAEANRPLTIGDPVSDTTEESNYGEIVSVVDATHANVQFLGSLRGEPGPNTVPTDEAVAGFIDNKASLTYIATAKAAITDDASMLDGMSLLTRGDSFGFNINSTFTFADVLVADRSMVHTNQNVSASFDRDVAMRGNGAALFPTQIGVLTGGVNPARLTPDGLSRQAEIGALQAAILQMCAASRIEAATETGTWIDVAATVFTGGNGRQSNTPTDTATWTNPAWGDYFGVGFTARSGIGVSFNSGTWKRGATVVSANRMTAPAQTFLEANDFAESAQNFAPWPVLLPALDGGETISMEVPSANLTTYDALWKLADTIPIIAVLIPGNTKPGMGLSIDPTVLEVFRGDRRDAIAQLTQAFPRLRGRVVPVELMAYGWDPAIHTGSDGLHPSDAGHELIATAIQRSIARAALLAPLTPSFGISGSHWPAWA